MKRRIATALTLTVVSLVGVSAQLARPTAAWTSAVLPHISAGDRGVNVSIAQHALGINVDGIFGPNMTTVVKAHQTRAKRPATGIIDAATWTLITPTVKQGATGNAVKALQFGLNAKHGTKLAIDGSFGPSVLAAVTSFQSKAQIGTDGIFGPVAWRNLLWRFVTPTFGGGLCDVNEGLADSWGTASVIGQLERLGVRQAALGRTVAANDISRELGGDFPPHSTHKTGLDVDLRPMRADGKECVSGCVYSTTCYDRAATRTVISQLRESGRVKSVIFNDPTLIAEFAGFVTSAAGHDDHLHVRFCEPSHATASYRC